MSWFCYFSKCNQQNASQRRRLWYFMIPCQCACVCACFFFYIKFYVSSSLSYCWAIRPPLRFSFFLCPFSLHSPFSAPTLVLSLFLPVSLTLPYLSFFLSDFLLLHFLFHCLPSRLLSVWLSLSHTSLPLFCFLPFLFLKVLIADGSRALFILSQLVSVSISGRSHSLSSRHRLPTAPRNKHTKWFPARGFCLRWGWRKTKKNRGFM